MSTVVVCGALVMVGAACSSSSSRTAPSTTHKPQATPTTASGPSSSSVAAGIVLAILPSDKTAAATVPPPAGFVACTAAKLTAPAKAAVAKVTNGNDIPADVSVWVLRAASACNRPYVLSTATADITVGDDALPGITAAQAMCASSGGLNAVVALPPDSVGSGTGSSSPVNQALAKSLDSCYPVDGFIDSQFRQGDPGVTPAQLACIHAKLGPETWASVAADSDTFQTQLQTAAAACAVS